jgi:hypothetical protein
VQGGQWVGDAPASAWALPGHPPRVAPLHPRPEQALSAVRAGTLVGTRRLPRSEWKSTEVGPHMQLFVEQVSVKD